MLYWQSSYLVEVALNKHCQMVTPLVKSLLKIATCVETGMGVLKAGKYFAVPEVTFRAAMPCSTQLANAKVVTTGGPGSDVTVMEQEATERYFPFIESMKEMKACKLPSPSSEVLMSWMKPGVKVSREVTELAKVTTPVSSSKLLK